MFVSYANETLGWQKQNLYINFILAVTSDLIRNQSNRSNQSNDNDLYSAKDDKAKEVGTASKFLFYTFFILLIILRL